MKPLKAALLCLLLTACNHGTLNVAKTPPMPPMPPARKLSVRPTAPVAPPPAFEFAFQFPANKSCNYNWTLQGSSNLVDWVDISTYVLSCPTGSVSIMADRPRYFFRLKGTP